MLPLSKTKIPGNHTLKKKRKHTADYERWREGGTPDRNLGTGGTTVVSTLIFLSASYIKSELEAEGARDSKTPISKDKNKTLTKACSLRHGTEKVAR